jgi:hypothetical protein
MAAKPVATKTMATKDTRITRCVHLPSVTFVIFVAVVFVAVVFVAIVSVATVCVARQE